MIKRDLCSILVCRVERTATTSTFAGPDLLACGPYYVFQRLCYIVFLEYPSKYLLDYYDTLAQFVLHPPLIFGTIVHYQRGVGKAHTLDIWKEIVK